MSERPRRNPLILMNPIRNNINRRKIRIDEQNNRRQARRSNLYLENRHIGTPSTSGCTERIENDRSNTNANVTKKTDPMLRERRNQRQRLNKSKSEKKPPFRVGTVKHKMDSPIFLHSSAPPIKFKAMLRSGKTRLKSQSTPVSNKKRGNERTTTRPVLSESRKRNERGPVSAGRSIVPKSKSPEINTQCSTKEDSHSSLNVSFTQDLGASTSTAGEQDASQQTAKASVLEDPKQTAETEMNRALIFSPFIVSSRGKENMRMEQQSRLGINSIHSDEIPTKETVMKMLNISIQEEEMTAQYFRHILDKEVKRLQNLCEVWLEQKLNDRTPEEAKLLINQAVGQTNLLIAKKFERFRGLVTDCEQGKGQMLVNCRDLQGFWDMMHLDIDNCNGRFKQLSVLKDNGWQNTDVELPTNKLQVKKAIRTRKKKVVPKKASSLRETIQALRNKKKDLSIKNEEFRTAASLQATNEAMLLAQREMIAFDAGFPAVNSPKKSVIHGRDVNRQSLSRAVRLSEGRKSEVQTVALRAMRVSNLFKPLRVEADESITYVNSTLTPGKSILKQAEADSTLNSTKSQQFDNSVKSDVIRTLDFCSDSDDEYDETLKNCTQDSKLSGSKNNSATNVTLVECSLFDSSEVRRRSRRSIQHNSPLVEIRKSISPRIKQENSVKDIDELSSTSPIKRKERQSSRKSIKFKEEYCFACTPSKPHTPGIRFSSQKLKKTDLLVDKFDTPSLKKKQAVSTPLKTFSGTRRSLRLAQKMQTTNDATQ